MLSVRLLSNRCSAFRPISYSHLFNHSQVLKISKRSLSSLLKCQTFSPILHCRLKIVNEIKPLQLKVNYSTSKVIHFDLNSKDDASTFKHEKADASTTTTTEEPEEINWDTFIAFKPTPKEDIPEHLLTATDIGLTWFLPTSMLKFI